MSNHRKRSFKLSPVLCPDKNLNYNDRYFFKGQGKKHSRTGGSARLFNAEIWKKNNILLSSLSGQSTNFNQFSPLIYTSLFLLSRTRKASNLLFFSSSDISLPLLSYIESFSGSYPNFKRILS